MFFSKKTRSDIEFATYVASHYVMNPNYLHIEIVKNIHKYLQGCKNPDIIYWEKTLTIKSHSNTNWASRMKSSKSIFNYFFIWNGRPISRCS